MEKLYSWEIVRSGAAMTITHSCGKLAGFTSVHYDTNDHVIIATHGDGRRFILGGVRGTLGDLG